MELVVFVAAAAMVLGGALGVILRPHPVHAALSLVLTLFGIAVLFVAQQANFLAVVQVIVYAGAIVVLFLFVVMLLNLRSDDFAPGRARLQRLAGALLGLALLAQAVRSSVAFGVFPPLPAGFGGYRQVGLALYTDYVLLVEVASLLLTAAIVGALILAKRKID
jgi:NADH-quinone oxidoreductase subunit J